MAPQSISSPHGEWGKKVTLDWSIALLRCHDFFHQASEYPLSQSINSRFATELAGQTIHGWIHSANSLPIVPIYLDFVGKLHISVAPSPGLTRRIVPRRTMLGCSQKTRDRNLATQLLTEDCPLTCWSVQGRRRAPNSTVHILIHTIHPQGSQHSYD